VINLTRLDFGGGFKPVGTPRELLALGIFEGRYFDDDPLSKDYVIAPRNFYGVSASKPRSYWLERGWINPQDPLGWFQWYLRYYEGRRSADDARQIARWLAFNARHGGALKKLGGGDLRRRRKQRQAMLHWACNSIADIDP
jgi:hypothetical protein